jgi:hypothetical protein
MQNHFRFVSRFEHVKFAINGKYSKNIYDNPNHYASLVIFQTYKNAILRSVHTLGGSFDCDFTHLKCTFLKNNIVEFFIVNNDDR